MSLIPIPPLTEILVHRRCRVCGLDLQEVLNLGPLRLNTFPRHPWDIPQVPQVPLVLTTCTGCGLVQLDRTVPPDWLYREYWYRSAVNESMVAELRDVVEEAVGLAPVGGGDNVLDIGANDGTLLAQYPAIGRSPTRVAVEPAVNLQERLDAHCESRVTDYWPPPKGLPLRFRIITAIACCYDTEQPIHFFDAIQQHLDPDGVALVQFQDLGQMLESAAFDNICHEHLEYYSLHSLIRILDEVGLTAVHCSRRAINGGSLRVVLRHTGQGEPDASIRAQLADEGAHLVGVTALQAQVALARFRTRIARVQAQVLAALQTAHDAGRVIDVYGASTKGNILLQVLGIGPALVRQAIDRSPAKAGCYTLTGIPIVDEAALEPGAEADLWLCPIWQFRESVLRRNRWFLDGGGTILFPLPACEIVQQTWLQTLIKESL